MSSSNANISLDCGGYLHPDLFLNPMDEFTAWAMAAMPSFLSGCLFIFLFVSPIFLRIVYKFMKKRPTLKPIDAVQQVPALPVLVPEEEPEAAIEVPVATERRVLYAVRRVPEPNYRAEIIYLTGLGVLTRSLMNEVNDDDDEVIEPPA